MRRILLNFSLLAILTAPLAANAASLDQITLTGTAGTYTYLVPSAPTSAQFTTDNSSYIELSNVPTTSNGVTTFDTIDFFASGIANGGGFGDFTGLNVDNPVTLAALFNDDFTAPLFLTGATGTFQDALNNTYNYTVTSYPPTSTGGTSSNAAAPEPSSLVLLGTGALGLMGSFRRRFVA